MQPEIQAYLRALAEKYNIYRHVTFRAEVISAEWQEKSASWLVTIQNTKTMEIYQRRCRILVSAVGALSTPKKCDIDGVEKFRGRIFHSAEWDHTFNWKDKDIIVIGTSCSLTTIHDD